MPSGRSRLPWYVRLQRAPGQLLQWLADFGAKLVWPIEWAFAAVGRMGLAVTERFENLESLGLQIGRFLLWPFRILWTLFARAAEFLLPESARHVLVAPFRGLAALGQWTGHALIRLAEALNLDGAILGLVKWTRPIWYPFAAIGGFLQAWLATRNYKQLLWGLPAVIVLVPILGAVTWTKIWGKGGIAAQYRIAVNEALDNKDFDRAQLFERKLAQLGEDSRMTDYQTAITLGNELDEAYERMKVLAPVDKPGFVAAHGWIIDNLIDSKLGLSPEENQRLLGIHLGHLESLGRREPEIQVLKSLWLVRDRRLAEASDILEPLINRLPMAAIIRMEVDQGLQRLEEARTDARAVRAHMQDRSRRRVKLMAQDYRAWTIAEEILGNTEQLETNIRAWLKLEPNNLEARRKLSDLCLLRFGELIVSTDPDPQQLADLFIEAAELTEDPRQLQRQVGLLYRVRDRVPTADKVIELVAASPRTQSAILEAAGTAAAAAGNLGQAKTYLQQAVTKDPRNSIAWNNFAYILMDSPQPDLPQALAAVNKALDIAPEDFHFRETRGQILVRLGKWQEAIPDLEFAANGLPLSRDVHLALANAYDGIGEKELARIHRQQAQ
jgi:tetratricopeptide (TPR) repeat protein